jgi:hypothetical protein
MLINLPAASREVSLEVKFILSQPRWAGFPLRYNKLWGIKPYGFRIVLKVIRAIRVVCEICGLKPYSSEPLIHSR